MARHLWRELCVDTWRDAEDAWQALRESSDWFNLEPEDFRAAHPRPTFKATLIGLKGWGNEPESYGCDYYDSAEDDWDGHEADLAAERYERSF